MITKITNLNEYLSFIKKHSKKEKSRKHLFYRGHADKNYKLEPSVFRDTIYGDKFDEKEIVLDFKQYAPVHDIEYDFVHDSDKVLADMQHYKLPTRLLDWTLAPLNALYFACCSNKNDNIKTYEVIKNGEVIILNPWKYWNAIVKDNSIDEIHQIHILSRALLSKGWKFNNIKKLIKNKYGYKNLKEEDIKEPFAFIASYTNNRILHQRGCFTIHGCNETALDNIKIANKFITRVEIDGKSKNSILDELNCLYINEYSIYPDFEGMQKMFKDTGSLFATNYFKPK